MVITQQILDQLFEIYDRITKYSELHSEQLKTVQDQWGHRKAEVERDGKKVKVSEKVLWEEVRHLGVESEAGKILREKYPDVFDSFDKLDKAREEARVFVLREMGFNFTQMTLSDYIKLTLALIDYANSQRIARPN